MSDDLTTKLYFGPWYRRSPYFDATLAAGCKAYDIYNKMYLPAEYDDVANEYKALNEGVTLWDVGVERTVQISGPDADRLTDMLTCRDLTKCAVNQGKYMLVIAPHGGIVNDPVLLHPGRTSGGCSSPTATPASTRSALPRRPASMRRSRYPDVHPVQVQGPKSALTLEKLVGQAIYDIKYYWTESFEIGDIPVVISRTGWSAVPGFEVDLLDGSRGTELWNLLMDAGEEYRDPADRAQRGAPGRGRHLQLGLGHHTGGHPVPRDGPGAPGRGAAAGLHRQGRARADPPRGRRPQAGRALVRRVRAAAGITRKWDAEHERRPVGPVTDAVWSPGLERNIGYVWVPIELAGEGTRIDVHSEHGPMSGVTHSIPFVDPRKERPAAALSRAS